MSVLDENRTFIFLRNKACLDPHAILNSHGKIHILGESMEKTETTIFVD
ncbi:hypothetical protein VN0739_14130 [Helicobacter pylori]|nr:hypothetical protein [Helicobacter pylori]GHP47681.1 hypothetical protein VN1184_14220 [Helicobacter pylori]GHQ32996.1 hypothetical protein VN0348_14010 [Helicobacter pylori]